MTDYEIKELLRFALQRSRADVGKTQQDMAKLVGVRYQTIQNWENGSSNPPFYQVYRWFDVLHLNMYQYVSTNKNVLEYIANAAASLPPEAQQHLIELLDDKNCCKYLMYFSLCKKGVAYEN